MSFKNPDKLKKKKKTGAKGQKNAVATKKAPVKKPKE